MLNSKLLKVCLVLSAFAFTTPIKNGKGDAGNVPAYSDDEYESRLNSISFAFKFEFTPAVKEYITQQTSLRGKATTEQILGLSKIYFPLFERELLLQEVPSQLKYVPWIESHLNAKVVSPMGAGGMWQFMPSTGAMYGLKINSFVDERLDPYKSTQAAAKLFKVLYDQYQDWAVVLAAYNCGSVKVNKAIKSAKATDFWSLCKYLPLETQRYIPRFIAAAYIGDYFSSHEITPVEMPEDYVVTDTIMVREKTTFKELSEETGVPIETIKFLNPSFLKSVIPANHQGYVITLPLKYIAALRGHETPTAYAGSTLAAATAKATKEAAASDDKNATNTEAAKAAQTSALNLKKPEIKVNKLIGVSRHATIGKDGYVYYAVQPGDNIWKIVRQYPQLTVNDLITLNGTDKVHSLKPGEFIRIFKN